jgi:hypothetical protein
MEAEATSVRFCGEEILFFPLLIDLGWDEIPHDSGWKTIHGDLTFGSHEEPSYIIGMVKQIMQVLQPSAFNDPDFNSNLAGKVRLLMDEWSKWKVLYPSPSLQFRGSVSVINAFKNDREFADWAYEYHRIVHHARDLVVRILDRYSHMGSPEHSLREILPPRESLPLSGSPSVMNLYRDPIGKMIRLLEIVFRRLVEGSDATVWVCLRDLRGDGHYHNFLRSESFPGADSRDEASTPWPHTCKTITTLLRTTAPCNPPDMENTSGQNCTIITDPSKDTWPPYLLQGDPQRKQSILGAVLLKKVEGNLPEPHAVQAGMWWILCVNSNKAGVFTEAHQRILQSCNDAFSIVANTVLRTERAARIASC